MKRAFTLLELLIYSAIVVIVVTLISGILYSISNFSVKNQARQEILQNARFASGTIGLDFSEADSVILPEEDDSSQELILQKDNDETVQYSLADSRLRRTVYEETELVTGNQVVISNLNFTRNSPADPADPVIITINFDCAYAGVVLGSQQVSQNFQFSEYIR